MKYLHFENANQDYNGYEGFIPVLIGSSWVGLAEVEDKVAKELKGTPGVTELSQKDWEWYKKKVGAEKIAFRDFNTIKQEPEKNPNASYAEVVKESPGKSASSDNPKDLIEVDVVEVENPLEEDEQPASKSKKGKK